MSNFYARYVPQTKEQLGTPEATAPLNGSTKRKRPEQDIPLREPKKTRSSSVTEVRQDDFGIKRFVPKKEKLRSAGEEHAVTEGTPPQVPIQQPKSTGYQVLEKYRVTGVARKNISDSDVQIRRPVREDTTAHEDTQALEPAKEPKPKKTKKKRRHHTQDGAESAEGVNGEAVVHQELPEDGFKKHGAVRDRFKKAKKISDLHHDEAPPQNVPKREVHGLEPLPQPPEVLQPDEPPTYSTLPPWLAKADLVAKNDETTFESLGLSDTVLANLKSSGLTRAMPIQSSVIPLLSKGTSRHDGDLAVAAATGSGKTLAYIIPLVETLKGLAITKLRVVIVVPTRELVKQVQETFNMYAEGTNLRAAIALGSKSVKEEAESLVESYEAYDPAAYEEQQSRKVNWTAFSLEELFDRMKDGSSPAPNHVTRYRSRADVLICTPGRLVEHLQTTKGFNLDNVQWLVIDEVDRLLNESYQEWLEVVMPALESRQATELRDKVLTSMGMDLLPRHVRTVILSATMTQDLSKLNSLNLHNPRLLVLEGEQGEELKDETHARGNVGKSTPDLTGAFKMPTTLTETTVLVGDGSDKPLHLLDLLRNQIASAEKPVTNGTIVQKSDASSSDSSDESSSSDSDSESSTRSPMSHENTMPPVKTPQYASTLIFTRSTESAPRLSRLLCILDPLLTSQVAVLTRSTTSSASSRKALKSFRAGTVSILITTDRAARGLDVPNIQHVINYDVPSSVQFYVHRVGRTARAGKEGKAWTLLAHREGRWFDKEIAKGEQVRRRGKVSKVTLEGVGKDKDIRKRYEDALKQLGEEVEGK